MLYITYIPKWRVKKSLHLQCWCFRLEWKLLFYFPIHKFILIFLELFSEKLSVTSEIIAIQHRKLCANQFSVFRDRQTHK